MIECHTRHSPNVWYPQVAKGHNLDSADIKYLSLQARIQRLILEKRGCCCFTYSWLSKLWFPLLGLNATTKSDLERKEYFYQLITLRSYSLHHWRSHRKNSRQEPEAEALEDQGSVLALQGFAQLIVPRTNQPRGGTFHSDLGPHTLISNQENAHQLCLRCLMELRFLFQDGPSLCQNYIKLANTLCYPNYV